MRKITKDILFSALTVLLLGALIFYIYLVAFSDGSGDASPEQIAAVLEDDTFSGMVRGDDNTLKRYFHITGLDGEYVVYTAESMMDVDELLIAKTTDPSGIDTLERAVENRLETQKKTFKGYGTDQTALLENAVIQTRGDYFFYAVSENADDWAQAFVEALR